MACTSSPGRLFAAPFSILGSIGVVGQTLNFYETLQKYGVEPLTFRSGKAKAPLTATGEITREGMAFVQSMLDDVHRAFQRHVAEARPVLAGRMEQIATGETWLGYDALEKGLIDRIITRYVCCEHLERQKIFINTNSLVLATNTCRSEFEKVPGY